MPPSADTTGISTASATICAIVASKKRDDDRRQDAGERVDEEPRDAGAGDVERRVGDLRVAGAGEAADVLLRLCLDDVHDVVDGEDADEAAALVDHRGGEEVVALEDARRLLLVLGGEDGVRLALHDLGDARGAAGTQQAVERHRAEQAEGGIDDEDLGERLGQVVLLLEGVGHLADGPERRHCDEVGLHPPPGRLLGEVERLLEAVAHREREQREDRLGVGVLEVLEDVDRVVGVELGEAVRGLLGLELGEDLNADRLVDLGQRREVELVAEGAHERDALLGVEALHEVGKVDLVEVLDDACEPGLVALARRGRGRGPASRR